MPTVSASQYTQYVRSNAYQNQVRTDGPTRLIHDTTPDNIMENMSLHVNSDNNYNNYNYNNNNNNKNKKKRKLSDQDIDIIIEALRQYSSLSLKSIRAHLYSKYEIDINETMLSKMRKEL